MPGKKNRVITVLNDTSVEYVKQYRTEDGQTFDQKDDAIGNATGIAFTKKAKAVLHIPTLAKLTDNDVNIAALLTDSELQLLSELGNAATILHSFRTTLIKKASI